ncbi:hypothetical protein [Muriicola marianensis]|uniref:DUF4476 domain-containing protein n=1 Tax=Muriicola marianensis TaxID=1324801 RepID=A0ABQ1R2L7_9FLAO|nr:hypothetical protein [Muriicola marianensis]GGD55125.1 hypothetical protein GCM10011361_22080 [Muriicola marianensis]
MKNSVFVIFLLLGLTAFSQSVLNNYKYVIVPTQFEGFRGENQYQTSTLVKYHLTEKGLNVFYDNAVPEEVNTNRCTALFTSLDNQSTMFTTKVSVVFKDCEGNEQFRTRLGSSKLKQYVEAYREALQEAFSSLKGFQYSYREPVDTAPTVLKFGDDVKSLPPASEMPSSLEPAEEETEVIQPEAGDKEETLLLPMPEETTEAVTLDEAVAQEEELAFPLSAPLYAQKTETGYQLVDTAPSIQFYLRETSLPNVYLAERKGQNGILYLKDGRWIFEFYRGADRLQEELQIKF